MTSDPTDDGLPDAVPDAPPAVADEDALASAVSRLPEAGDVRFGIKGFGGGYDRTEVDAFVHRVSQDAASVRAAAETNRAELASLRAENAELRKAAGSDLEQEIAAGAVGLLSQAQLIADRAVADAEQYARDLVVAARDQYREVLERAERSAGHVVAGLAAGLAAEPAQSAQPSQAGGPALPEIEYVRTYAKVAQIQLRSVLDALTEQVDRLGSLPLTDPEQGADAAIADPPIADDEPVEEPIEEPDWSRPVATRGSFVEPETFSMPGSFAESSAFAESDPSSPPAFPEARTGT